MVVGSGMDPSQMRWYYVQPQISALLIWSDTDGIIQYPLLTKSFGLPLTKEHSSYPIRPARIRQILYEILLRWMDPRTLTRTSKSIEREKNILFVEHLGYRPWRDENTTLIEGKIFFNTVQGISSTPAAFVLLSCLTAVASLYCGTPTYIEYPLKTSSTLRILAWRRLIALNFRLGLILAYAQKARIYCDPVHIILFGAVYNQCKTGPSAPVVLALKHPVTGHIIIFYIVLFVVLLNEGVLVAERSKTRELGSELQIAEVRMLSVTEALFISTIDLVLYRLPQLFSLIRSSHRLVAHENDRNKA
ncbi:hypothetical protein J6590_083436 [Homalodisca vitripennis]|nr:hypothetical protein J6590_083436 [Homalodisca vitripennis]